jgi:hypothetical protein
VANEGWGFSKTVKPAKLEEAAAWLKPGSLNKRKLVKENS